MRFFTLILSIAYFFPTLTSAQAVPDSRFLYSESTDFYGSDLGNLFDTTKEACERACFAQEACVAFTFNLHKNACFPKSAITDRQPYPGALSAVKVMTPQGLKNQAEARAANLTFLNSDDIAKASAFVRKNSARVTIDDTPLPDLIDVVNRNRGQNTSRAERYAATVVALTDSAPHWTTLAELSLKNWDNSSSQTRNHMRKQSLHASINAYLRAPDIPQQVRALDLLSLALERNDRGRDMIKALRMAHDLQPRDDLSQRLDAAIEKYGFRVTDHRVDNDSATPRICAEFSEMLAKNGVDYEPFVQTGDPSLTVQADGKQLCIDGVTHGTRYDVTLREGLPTANGEALHRDVRLRLYVQDRTPIARFPGRAFVLPRSADAGLPIETVNTDEVELHLWRVSDRNLLRAIQNNYFGVPMSKYDVDYFNDRIAQKIWAGTAEVQNDLNRDMTTRLPLGDVLADQRPGVFALSAAIAGQDPYDYPAAVQWFVLTDTGLTVLEGTDGVSVATRALSDAGPLNGVELTLISRANEVLGSTVSDADGYAKFPAALSRGSGSAGPALIVARRGEDDIAFLPLTDAAFDLSDRGVEGRAPSPAIDTFMTTDRGAYRVGETIHVTALIRDAQVSAIEGLPVMAVLKRPDGVEYSRQLSQNAQAGGHVFALKIGNGVPRGVWRLDLIADPADGPLASKTVLVEDFLPERIDATLTLADAPLALGQHTPLNINARYLFGATGSDLATEGELRLSSQRTMDAYPGYQFGRYDVRFNTRTRYLDSARTDAAGNAVMQLKLPKLDEAPGIPLKAVATIRVSEGSGRPIERQITRPVASDSPMIGIKSAFDYTLPEGADAGFSLIAIGADNVPVTWTLNRVEHRYQWYQQYGDWNWEPITRRIRTAQGTAKLGTLPVDLSLPTEWGNYELIVETMGQPFAASSIEFSSGWYGSDDSSATPDRLDLSLDAQSYDAGDTARLRINAPTDGVALLSVLSNRVIERRAVPVSAGENLIDLNVTNDWGSGAYVMASVIRPMNVSAGVNPARSLGIAHAAVNPGTRKLAVRIDAPEVVNGQKGSFAATVQVDGLTNGENAYVTLAAVDQGILNLTNFKAPDPAGHYFGQRRLGVEVRDVYGRLIDGMNGAMGRVRSGGDAGTTAQLQSPPPTEKLMSFFTGPVKVGPDGRATVQIDKPAFNGQVRLMAIAWSKSAVGNAEDETLARDPVVLTASLPRVLAPGDRSRLLLELVHADGPTGTMPLEVLSSGGISIAGAPDTVTLDANASARLDLPITAQNIGDHKIQVRLTTPNGTQLEKTLMMPVRSNDPETSTTRQLTLASGEVFTFDTAVLDGLKPATAFATLSAGPIARYNVPGLLRQLDRYPYGCSEQITSAAMPLLYMSSLAGGAGIKDLDKKIDSAIARVLSRQSSNGAFGMWRVGSGNFWLDAYVTDFLSRAKAQGYNVPARALAQAMDNLRNQVAYASDFEKGGQDIAYALLVLARAGAASMSDLRYYADIKGESFGTPMAAAQLGAALAAYGDPVRADQMFSRAAFMLTRLGRNNGWRDDFGTNLRDTAAVVRLSAEAGSKAVNFTNMLHMVRFDNKRLSTQEAAQVVMVAHALQQSGVDTGLRIDGAIPNGPIVHRLSMSDNTPVRIENVGTQTGLVNITSFGVPKVAPPEGGYGYALTRRYFTMGGTEVTGPVATGTRLVAVLEVRPFEDVGARLIIDDPLPGGFEIDNPNLLRGGDVKALDWLKPIRPQNVEFRADRFIAAVDHRKSKPFQLAYIVRAVSPGDYHHPAAIVEDMYRPEYRAITATSRVQVTP